MATSSARPDDLERFASASRALDDVLRQRLARLKALHRSFEANTTWGTLAADSMLAGFGRFIDANDEDARWVAHIAGLFRRAGGDGAISTLPDAAIAASLKAAGFDGGRTSITFDDPVAYGMPPTSGYADDPINTASGNFVEVENDLPFAALAEGLKLVRTYNSRSTRDGGFGPGWSSWASARLRARPEGAEYEGPDGQRAIFPRLGAGYGRVVGVGAPVEAGPSGLTLAWFGGARWDFDDAGLPLRTSAGPGSAVSFGHEDGRLVELAHEGGARVTISWEADRIVSAASSDGRAVRYRYDDDGHLVGVEGGGGTRRYSLDEAGRVVAVADADGVVEVANTYDEDGRVVEQVSRFDRTARFHYLPGGVTVNEDEGGDVTNTYLHDHAGRAWWG